MNFGYIRVSHASQNLDRQVEEMKKLNLDKVYADKLSGKNTERPELQELLKVLRNGDTVTVLSFDRFARNTKDLLSMVEEMNDKGVEFKSLKENVDTSTPTGKFFITIVGAVAELERSNILERQRQGIELAKRKGKYHGRKPKELEGFEGIYKQWCEGKITLEQAGKLLGVSRATFYRRVRAYEGSITIDFGGDAVKPTLR